MDYSQENKYYQEWYKITQNSVSIFDNPSKYLEQIENGTHESVVRKKLTRKYSWAIPNQLAIDTIKKYSPIVEIGAGTGYWASLIKEDIVCYDISPYFNDYHDGDSYFPVVQGDYRVLVNYPNHSLMLCWPPYATSMAFDCLEAYTGKIVIFIGELGGCTGDENFYRSLLYDFNKIETVKIPNYSGIWDSLTIWERK